MWVIEKSVELLTKKCPLWTLNHLNQLKVDFLLKFSSHSYSIETILVKKVTHFVRIPRHLSKMLIFRIFFSHHHCCTALETLCIEHFEQAKNDFDVVMPFGRFYLISI